MIKKMKICGECGTKTFTAFTNETFSIDDVVEVE
jgi:hypothetical protein